MDETLKRIVYLSFYFEPDLCAGSFRNSPLANELASQVEGEAIVEVYTTLPNRYSSFSPEAPEYEQRGNLIIHRIALPVHKSGMADQIRSFSRYFFSVLRLNRNRNADLVFASSSRLFTAYLGSVLSGKFKAPLYLDIRDLFVDTISDVIRSRFVRAMVLPVLKWVEKRTFSSATHLNLISGGFRPYVERYPEPAISGFTNGIDDVFIGQSSNQKIAKNGKNHGKTILYAGNIGEGQGLHRIVPDAAAALADSHKFVIIGDGGMKPKLRAELESRNIRNVELKDPVPRSTLIEAYRSADILLIHLNDYPAFRKVLPSKIFEMAAMNKPIVAGVSGFAAEFLEKEVPQSYLFEPCNADGLVKLLQEQVSGGEINRDEFIQRNRRSEINRLMAESIRSYL